MAGMKGESPHRMPGQAGPPGPAGGKGAAPPQTGTGADAAARFPPHVPDHELLRVIGAGSYGEVWLARNALGTLRAVKVVHRHGFEDERPFEREFKGIQEFEPLSRTHEGLVDILQVGRSDDAGHFYYVMELADGAEPQPCDQSSVVSQQSRKSADPATAGSPLNTDNCSLITAYTPRTLRSDFKRHGRLPAAECVRIGLSLTRAVEHLHAHGLVHRDLKPSNIIFVGGVPKLADIGLVARTDKAHSLVGTLGFIPPEGSGTPRADLFSLGKVLYEISTGKDRQEFPQLPPKLRELPDAEPLVEFNEVVLKACENDPRRRYASARAMHDELALLQRGQSVMSRRTRQRYWTWLRKALVSAAVIAVVLGGGWHLRDVQQRDGRRGTANAEAYDAFERGRFFWKKRTEEGLLSGTRYFQAAIEKDPNFARAYAGLADCYVLLVHYSDRFLEEETISKARAAAQEALKLDNGLVEAHTTMAFIRSTYDRDPLGADEQFDRALKLDPRYATAHHWRAFNLAQRGLAEAAVASMRRALELDPASVIINADTALMLFLARQYDLAIEQARRGIELDPNFHRPYVMLFLAYGQKGMHDEAVTAAHRVIELKKRNHASVIWLAQAMAWQGLAAEARRLLDELPPDWKSQPRLPCLAVELAILHVALGDREKAFEYLELAWTLRDLDLRWLKLDPRFDRLRGDPRFQSLLKRMGLGE